MWTRTASPSGEAEWVDTHCGHVIRGHQWFTIRLFQSQVVNDCSFSHTIRSRCERRVTTAVTVDSRFENATSQRCISMPRISDVLFGLDKLEVHSSNKSDMIATWYSRMLLQHRGIRLHPSQLLLQSCWTAGHRFPFGNRRLTRNYYSSGSVPPH